jgi:hypothetical protein
MKTALSAVKMETLAMDVHMVWMKEMSGLMTSAELLLQRKTLNLKFHSFLKINLRVAKSSYEMPVYVQFCPMANG